MARCVFNKKHPDLKGYYKCTITGQVRKGRCYKHKYACKNFTVSLHNKLLNWFNNLLER